MALNKLLSLFYSFINGWLFVTAWIINFDSLKSDILFIVALIMSMYRFYRWVILSKQKKDLIDIEKEKKKMENIILKRKIDTDEETF